MVHFEEKVSFAIVSVPKRDGVRDTAIKFVEGHTLTRPGDVGRNRLPKLGSVIGADPLQFLAAVGDYERRRLRFKQFRDFVPAHATMPPSANWPLVIPQFFEWQAYYDAFVWIHDSPIISRWPLGVGPGSSCRQQPNYLTSISPVISGCIEQ
jgi:hypothetical protein